MKSTLKHFKNYLSGDILVKAIAFIYIPILTRLLPVEDYGILNIFNSYVILFTIIMTLNTHSSLSRYLYEKEKDVSGFYFTNFVLTFGLFVLFSIILLLLKNIIGDFVGVESNVVIMYIPIVLFTILQSFYIQTYQPKQESRRILIVNVIYSIISFIIKISFILFFGKTYQSVVYATVIIDVIFIVYYFLTLFKFAGSHFSKSYLKYILNYTLPLIPYTLGGILLSYFDRIMISKIIGDSQAGLYSLAYNIGLLFSVFYRALMITAWMPKYFEYMNEKNYKQHDKDIVNMLKIISLVALLFIFFSSDFGNIIVGKSYKASLTIIPLITLGYFWECIHYIFLKNAAYAKKNIYPTIVLFSSTLINIGLNIWLLPIYGYEIAALTTAVSYFAMAILSWITNKYILKMHSIKLKLIYKEILVVVICVIFEYFCNDFIDSIIIINGIKIVSFIVLLYAFFSKQIMKILVKNEAD